MTLPKQFRPWFCVASARLPRNIVHWLILSPLLHWVDIFFIGMKLNHWSRRMRWYRPWWQSWLWEAYFVWFSPALFTFGGAARLGPSGQCVLTRQYLNARYRFSRLLMWWPPCPSGHLRRRMWKNPISLKTCHQSFYWSHSMTLPIGTVHVDILWCKWLIFLLYDDCLVAVSKYCFQ